jgi:hypothetical protein
MKGAELWSARVSRTIAPGLWRAQPKSKRNATEDGRAFGATLALKHILGLLERKGLVTHNELTSVLDDAQEETRAIADRTAMAPDSAAAAGRAIGLLYVRQ